MGLFGKSGKGGRTVADVLPYAELRADGDVLTKDWGLMRTWRVEYPDSALDPGSAADAAARVARTFHNHTESSSETKVEYWFVTCRVPMRVAADPVSTGEEGMAGADLEIERRRAAAFGDQRRNNSNVNYCCCKVGARLDAGGAGGAGEAKAEELFAGFEGALATIGARPRRLSCSAEGPLDSAMGFLKHMVCDTVAPFRCPEGGMAGLDAFLSTRSLAKGRPIRLGDAYVQMLTVSAFPHQTYPNILSAVLRLPFCFRWVTRWVPRSNWESQQMAKRMRKEYKAGLKSWSTVAYEASTGVDSGTVETQAATDVEDMEEVLGLLSRGETLGEMTSVLALSADDPAALREQVALARRAVVACGFDVIEEDVAGNFPAWLSSLPGESSANRRRPVVTATNISHIVPFTNLYRGSMTNSYLKRLTGVGWPLAIGRLPTNELYYLNLNGPSDDVGHTFVVGSTGGGKSVLLALLASQWARYPRSRVVLFDKDMSFANLCRRSGGAVYVPAAPDSDLQFMPLSRIADRPEQAQRWLEVAVGASGTPVGPETAADLSAVCRGWAAGTPTLERFVLRLRGHNPKSAALPALERILDDAPLAKLFGAASDEFGAGSFRRKTMVEMGLLMNMGPHALLPALQFVFDRLDELFDDDPQPTLLVLDEAWKFLRHEVFRSKIKEWLKTLRKKNVFVVFALQNINDIDDPEEFLTSCHTRIFLPNRECGPSGSKAVKDLYLKMGVKPNEIAVIGAAERKAQYFVVQPEGSALVDFGVDGYQLERLARDGV